MNTLSSTSPKRKTRSLTFELVEQLGAEIQNGSLTQGQKLPTEAAALAAVRRSDDNLRVMQEALIAFSNAIEGGRDAIAADFQFHHEIARATQNNHFADMMNSLGSQAIPRARLATDVSQDPPKLNYLRRVHHEHENILNAIAAQDAESARAAMRTHLSNSRDRHKKRAAEQT